MAVAIYSIKNWLSASQKSASDVLEFLTSTVEHKEEGWHGFKPNKDSALWRAVVSCVEGTGCVIVRSGYRKRVLAVGAHDLVSQTYSVLVRDPDGTTHLVLVTFSDYI